MFERFGTGPRQVLRRAQLRARAQGAATFEASDLLLALAEEPSGRVREVLGEVGLDADTLRDGLRREFASALAAVGVHEDVPARRVPIGSRRGPYPRWGESAKLALRRSLGEAVRRGERPMGSEHLLLAIVDAEAGVVPRLLEELRVSPSRIREALG